MEYRVKFEIDVMFKNRTVSCKTGDIQIETPYSLDEVKAPESRRPLIALIMSDLRTKVRQQILDLRVTKIIQL